MRKYSAIGTAQSPTRGVGKSGSCGLPSTRLRLQRRAISTLLASALGRSANSASICAWRLEVLLAAEALHALRVGQHLAFGDADAGLVRLVVVGAEELHAVRRDHRQPQLGGQRHRGAHMRLVARQAGALQLDVEAVAEGARCPLRQRPRARIVAGQQGLADRAVLGARQHDQARVALGQPGPLDQGVAALGVVEPAARQQLARFR